MKWFFYLGLFLSGAGLLISLANLILAPGAGLISLLFGIGWAALFTWLLATSRLWPVGLGKRWVAAALAWGAGTSLLLVMAGSGGYMEATRLAGSELTMASFAGALPEEVAKGLGAFFIIYLCPRITRPYHALTVGILVGLGFEAMENFGYGTVGAMYHPSSDLLGMLQMWGLRTVAGPGLHMVFTGILAYGLGLWLFTSHTWRVAALGWGLSTLFHFWWNLQPSSEPVQIASLIACAIVMYATFIAVVIHALRAARADTSLYDTPTLLLRV